MSLADSLAPGLLIFADCDPRTITYRPRTNADEMAAGYSVAGVVREDVSTSQQSAAGAGLRQGKTVYHVLAARLQAAPQLYDWIDDADGTAWTVEGIDGQGEGRRYRLTCTRRV